ncbi:phenylalanine ammonia-lyase StlA [Photorhabdus stackebrandtii]|uniref:Histidine ammonia-lyase n=1 Tax=Photorhabdus stackebrandtii TaxID=1123042 RepID=A0A7X5QK50_9GAMM|nr:phenylalanine ammonia-lyase StlA [Photorhabdus stackebrandtii]NHB95729.1 histidine ammonia-lyase [Photorhabdus stackebrandtii]
MKSKDVQPTIIINNNNVIALEDIYNIAIKQKKVEISKDIIELLSRGREKLEEKLNSGEVIYGINTGFGGNANLVVPFDKISEHQKNLLTFLSAGTGDFMSKTCIKASQFTMLLSVCKGWSATRPIVAQTIADHINHDIVPLVPRYGSVGASGDLVPLSYIARALCGIGKVYYMGEEISAAEAIKHAGLTPLSLEAKEGLALINGTRVMSGISAIAVIKLEKLFKAAISAIALAVEALLASHEHYDARIQQVKNHPGQKAVASALRNLLAGSTQINLLSGIKEQANKVCRHQEVTQLNDTLQEVYSIRCAPQILGIVPESLASARKILEREVISANDNPLVDPENGDVLHGGNFMGQYVARTMDALKLDIALVANHLHAIVALMMDNRFSRGLPNSLSPTPGMYQGFKGVQLSQTALVAAIRHDCAASGIHTLATEQYNQDIVSLGLHAAQDVLEMEQKLRNIVSMTILVVCQAIYLRGNISQIAPETAKFYHAVREICPPLVTDRALDSDIIRIADAIINDQLPLPEILLEE